MLQRTNKNNKSKARHLLLALAASALGFTATVSASAAPAPAGTSITNQAQATYFNTRLGTFETVESNTVSAEVLPVAALDLTGEQVIRTSRSSPSQYNFRVENVGNVEIDAGFDIAELQNDNFDVFGGELLIDTNGNGVVDSGDIPISPEATRPLAPGEMTSLIYRFATPATVEQDDLSITELTVTGHSMVDGLEPIVLSRQSRTIIDESTLLLRKEASLRADAGEIDYTIFARNNSGTPIAPYDTLEGQTLTVDGTTRTALVVRDPIPLNTTFVSASDAGGFEAVYHIEGERKHSYTAVLPDDLSTVDAVGFLHDEVFGPSRSSDLRFTVAISPTVSEQDILNTAHGFVSDGTTTLESDSNEVITPVSGAGATITFVSGPEGTPISDTPFDTNVSVVIGAASCNLTDAVDAVEVIVTTESLNDREVLRARETGPNTGVFETSPVAVVRGTQAVPLNSLLEGLPGDNAGASAVAQCLGETLSTEIGLQPGGFVFDSVTNDPVPGARVAVYAQGDSETILAESVTDSLGYFDLGALPQGMYRLVVFPPSNYAYPSVRDAFPGFDRNVDMQASYGVDFNFEGGPISNIDVPLDPSVGIALAIEKTSDRSSVRRGGYVIYTLSVRNQMDQALLNAAVDDQLPPGFHYVSGTARRDDAAFASDPVVSGSNLLSFDLETIQPNTETTITYAVRIGTAAGRGDKTNTALVRGLQSGTGTPQQSEVARSTVSVDDRGGVFADEAVVIGRVFLDRNGDGIQTELDEDDNPHNEPGVPGVKIVTSTGLTVVTDLEGRYSLFGLRPTTQVFALQSGTLPRTAIPMHVEIDDALAPGSRLIDLKRGELRAEDFPLVWTEAAEADVAKRAGRFEELARDESLLRDDLPLTFDAVTRNSSRNEAGLDTKTELLTVADAKETAATGREETRERERVNIEEQIKTLDPKLGFVDVADGDEIGRPAITVRVKGPIAGSLRLEANGEEVPAEQIGAKVTHRDGGVQVFEYVAIRLRPEANTLTAIVTDPFGNDRGREEITIYAPGEPAGIVIVAPEKAPANSRARIPVLVRIVDAAGRLVRVPAEVTLTADNGAWDVRDIRDAKHGLQAYIDNGEATFDFIPPDLVGSETIGIEADFATFEGDIGFTPDLTERTFVGVIEGAVKLREEGSRIEGLMERDDISSFEETTEGVRGQLYLKGKILGENLLTLRYDSDQDSEERLFRDIRRDEFYPVYGDSSERGFDAQSDSEIYVKVEREQSYILYGDLAIESQADAIRLGAYRRSLTGGRAHIEQGPVTVDLFVAETNEAQRVVEFRGRGVSGPYDVDFDGIAEGSEVIEIVTRDRDQPDVILSAQSQTRLSDYTIDFFRGAIIFNRPIPQIDENLNPISIRVTYETEEGSGEDYLVYGGEIRIEPVEGVAVGYREVRSDASRDLDERRTVRAAYAEAELRGWGKVQVELAQTENNLGEKGEAARLSYEFRNDDHIIRAEAARTDENFDAPNSYVNAGREEARLTTDHKLTDRLSVGTDTLFTKNTETDDRRLGSEVKGRYAIMPSLGITAGLRGVETRSDGGERDEVYSGIIGADWRPTFLPGASLLMEYEQDFKESDNWRLTLGGDYQWNPKLRFYALNEISSAETGFFGLGDGVQTNFTTKVGAEYQMTEEISGFSEFRQSGSTASDGGVANGVRGQWALTEQLAMRMSAEHVEPISDEDTRSSSATLGFAYDNEETGIIWRNDVEVERDEVGMGVFTNTAFGYELDKDLTVLARNRLAVDLRGDNRIRDRLRFGLAYRPEFETRVKALALYEFEIDDTVELTEQAHRWSFGGTYSPNDDIRMNAKYAGEHNDIDGPGFSDTSTLHLGRAGIEFDFGKDRFERDRFALGGHVAGFTDNAGSDVTLGVGIELKVNVMKNVQVGVGYNHIDVDEDRLRDLYHSGLYARIRLKLDESIWDEFDNLGLTTAPGID
jgi:uncharacterized repeat protein (TIGR01451 family)